MSSRLSTALASMIPSATASTTPCATPACAPPQVSSACRSPAMNALLTNSVNGLTGNPGRKTVTNGACPWVGWASADAHATSTGPPFAPSTVLICAAFAPSPTKLSPNCVWNPSAIAGSRTLGVSPVQRLRGRAHPTEVGATRRMRERHSRMRRGRGHAHVAHPSDYPLLRPTTRLFCFRPHEQTAENYRDEKESGHVANQVTVMHGRRRLHRHDAAMHDARPHCEPDQAAMGLRI